MSQVSELSSNPDTALHLVSVIAGFALGVIDEAGRLPQDKQEREKPSGRKPLEEIWIQI